MPLLNYSRYPHSAFICLVGKSPFLTLFLRKVIGLQMTVFRHGLFRVFTLIPLIAFLLFELSLLESQGAGFVVTQPIMDAKPMLPTIASLNPWYVLSALLVVIGIAGYLHKKKDSR